MHKQRSGGGEGDKSGSSGGGTIEIENPMEAGKKQKEKKKKNKEKATLELEMTAVSDAGAVLNPALSNPVKRHDGRPDDDDNDNAVSVTVARREVPILSGGWTACIDDASGDTYYHQADTDKVQWEMPAEARPTKLNRKPTFMPKGWEKMFTEEGKCYYIDPIGTSQWEKPPGN